MYPAMIQDLPYVIPVLASKLEVIPHAEDIDTTMSRAVLGWNLFALGNNRMYLGETYHNNLRDLARQIKSGSISGPGVNVIPGSVSTARNQTTPKNVIMFVTRVLGDHKAGYTDLNPSTVPFRQPGDAFAAKQTLAGMPQQFFSRSGY